MKHNTSLRYIDQLALFKLRGITGINLKVHQHNTSNLKQQLRTISTIGYYNLKNYATPYQKNNSLNYDNLSFNSLVARYYRDKRLKQAVLHAIEDIETTLNTKIANVLGEYGSYGYLNFRDWCQRNSKNKYLRNKFMDKFAIEHEQLNFLRNIQTLVKKSYSNDMKYFAKDTEKVYPPIWLLMNELTLGTSIHIYKLMNKSNRQKISNYFNCKSDELVSWLENINLVRNICCHNGILVDFKSRTKAKVPQEFKNGDILLKLNNGNYTNHLALQLCIIVKLMSKINNKYAYTNLKNAVTNLISPNTTPQYYGFISKSSIDILFSKKFNTTTKNLIEY